MAKLAKQPEKIFVLMNNDEFVSYFKDFTGAFTHVEKNELEDAVILEVVAATRVQVPEEPEFEAYEISVKSLLG
jgi:hypothetical protein